jgi:hypothetical protein
MTKFWIVRNGAGIVRAASVAEFTSPETLKEWRNQGRLIEMIDVENLTLNRPLPEDVKPI